MTHAGLRSWALLALALVLSFVVGCASRDTITCSPSDLSGCVVDEVEIIGNKALDDDEIEQRIATAETGGALEHVPLLGAIDALTVEYERFDRFVLERDLQRVARLYRAKGYYKAVVRAGRVRRIDEPRSKDPRAVRTQVEIVVEEGMPTRVRRVSLVWRDWDPATGDSKAGAAATNAKNTLSPGAVFTEEAYEDVRKRIQRELTDLGYAYALVDAKAAVDLQTDETKDDAADVTFTVELGPKCTFGNVTLEGLDTIPDWQIRPALGFEEDDEYSTDKLKDAEVALNEFGVFASIEITPQLSKSPPRATKIPIEIVARPGALRAVRLGGGIELGGAIATHGIAGWQHKNLFGALDRFNIEVRPRLVLYPLKLLTLFDFNQNPPLDENGEPIELGGVRPVYELVGRLAYQLPIPYDPRTTFFVQGQGSVALERNHDIPDFYAVNTNIPGEYVAEQRVGIERRFFLSRLLVGIAHNLSYSQPFSYNLEEPPPGKEALLLSYLQHYAEVDLRRGPDGEFNRLNPTSGVLAGFDLQMAGFFVGGDASDVKIRPEIRFFAPLSRRVIVAGRFAMGFLYVHDYRRDDDAVEGIPILDQDITTADVAVTDQSNGDPDLRRKLTRDAQILTKRGLFSGGPMSNRGYTFNEIAPHRVLDDDGKLLADPDAIGGRTLWEASLELRFPIVGDLGGVFFIDSSDVTRDLGQLRLDHPHVASGLGIRYETPVGPLRLDLGFRIPYLQVLGEDVVESCIKRGAAITDVSQRCPTLVIDEGDATDFLGPSALAIAIGHAF